MRRLFRRRSLGWRMILGLTLGEVLFAVVLSVTVGAFLLLTIAAEREDSIRRVSSVIAASLMPMVAEQQESHVEAQLSSILKAGEVDDVRCIRIVDSSGATLFTAGEKGGCVAPTFKNSQSPLSFLTEPRVVQQPLTVDGLRVATVYVSFTPPGLAASLRTPAVAGALVLLMAVVVSIPWSGWWFLRDVAEPVNDLASYASRIAEGDLDASPQTAGFGEIADLQRTLSRMAAQLKDRDERLRHSYDELSEAYRSLEAAKHEIEQLASLKADFVAVAAHELRGPLSTVALYAELLEMGELGELDEQTLEAVAAIGSASARLRSIVLDLMDSALLERGLMSMSVDDVWLQLLVEGAVADADAHGRARKMAVRIEGELPDVIVRGDVLRLRQLLDNLLSNALKYSPEGTEVTVRAREDAQWIEVDVCDRGRGIAQEDREKLFKLFGRLDFGDSRETAGLGLGLAISSRIAKAHGGNLSFHPNEGGVGTVFTLRLPPKSSISDDRISAAFSVSARGGDE